ncbi:NiFe hydrogenase [Shewanella sp. HL-SH2]|uniref:NiFe hydrogenase n=1 Tax=Shewanella sp. HL-SH2 TaxID=3436238 RepID=UPI003EBD1DB6
MKHLIQFEFVCLKPVPLYAYLCQYFTLRTEFDISFGIVKDDKQLTHYIIEACALQTELESLADEIAANFLLSVWLVDTQIKRIHNKQFPPVEALKSLSTAPLSSAPLLYCQHCQPIFGDNQSQQFGELNLLCAHCHGETKLTAVQQGLTANDIRTMVDTLLIQGELPLLSEKLILSIDEPLKNSTSESLSEHLTLRPHILICNPNTLNAQFLVNDYQVLALSSIEKPILTLVSCDKQTESENCSHAIRYDVQFAYNRLLQVICERLRQKGINWVYISPTADKKRLQAKHAEVNKPLRLARVNHQWITIQQTTEAISIDILQPCLHDHAVFNDGNKQFTATDQSNSQDHLKTIFLSHCIYSEEDLAANAEQITTNLSENDQHLGYRSLLAGLANRPDKPKNAAVLYFSQQHKSQIFTLDGQSKAECFFEFAAIPENGYEICHQILSSKQAHLLNKFKQQFPQSYLRLLDLKLPQQNANLSGLLPMAAIIIGCPINENSPHSVTQQLLDGIISLAQCYQGSNAPRIDFQLVKGEAVRSLNWCKTLGTLMSFRIAGEQDKAKLAYGFFDSFADYLSNWLAHLDQNIGINQLVLAGSEFSYPPLVRQIQLRLANNFTLVVDSQMDLDGVNIAVGGLLLPIRRRGGAV